MAQKAGALTCLFYSATSANAEKAVAPIREQRRLPMRTRLVSVAAGLCVIVCILGVHGMILADTPKAALQVPAETPTPFLNPARQGLIAPTALEPVAIDAELNRIRADGGSIDLDVYRSEKVQKAVFCDIRLHATNVSEKSVMLWPGDGYDFPALWLNLTQMPGINVAIFDFIPMLDIVAHEPYAVRYMAGMRALREKAFAVLGDTVIDKAFELTSLAIHALSPYRLIVMVSDAGAERIPLVMDEYIRVYRDIIHNAGPIEDKELRALCQERKAAISRLLKANDPGYPFMVKVFGQAKTDAVFEVVF